MGTGPNNTKLRGEISDEQYILCTILSYLDQSPRGSQRKGGNHGIYI